MTEPISKLLRTGRAVARHRLTSVRGGDPRGPAAGLIRGKCQPFVQGCAARPRGLPGSRTIPHPLTISCEVGWWRLCVPGAQHRDAVTAAANTKLARLANLDDDVHRRVDPMPYQLFWAVRPVGPTPWRRETCKTSGLLGRLAVTTFGIADAIGVERGARLQNERAAVRRCCPAGQRGRISRPAILGEPVRFRKIC